MTTKIRKKNSPNYKNYAKYFEVERILGDFIPFGDANDHNEYGQVGEL
jgi:hypothetical protein